jgi:Head domain of trimeric autotransporter adhesin
MALIPGSVRVAGFLAPSDSTDTYAVTDETYNRGGYRTVADIASRNAITADRRKEGMLVRILSTSDTYVLVGGILDVNWTLFTLTSSQALQVLAVAENATTPNPGAPTLIWSSVTGSLLVWNGTTWISTVSDPDLQALANLNTTGVMVRTGSGTVATRVIAGTAGQIQVLNGDGQVTSPSIALTNTGVAPGVYPKVTVDAQGRVTAGTTLTAADLPSDITNLYHENFTTGAVATATGANAVAIGNGAVAQSNNSIALGEQSIARHQGAVMQAAGRFVVSGDAQVGSYLLKGVTTSNIPRQLYLDGPSGTSPLIIPDNSTWTFKITVTAHRTDANDGHSGYFIKGVVYRQSGPGTTTIQGYTSVEVLSQSDPVWYINTVADNVNGCLAITVTGESGKTIRWLAHVETVEITG